MRGKTVPAIGRPLSSWIRFSAGAQRAFRRPQFWFGVIVLVPIMAYYAVFGFGPIVRSFWMAVVDYRILAPAESPFVGLKHFRELLRYDLFWIALQHTLIYAGSLFVTVIPVAFIISLCLINVRRGRGFFQFVVFLPVVLSMVAVGLLFKLLMDPQLGPLNRILSAVGLPRSRFLSGPESALASVIGVDIWKSFGFYVVILTAGLLNIPSEMYDAAKVDGANALQCLKNVTIPLLGHTLALACIMLLMGGLQVYTQVVILPNSAGGPARSTYVLNLLVTTEAFQHMRFGFATAAAFVLFLLIFVITLIQLRLLRPKWSY
ncbi:MAG: carbohydrate ABC transporter permease [Anaerolineae bacterium]